MWTNIETWNKSDLKEVREGEDELGLEQGDWPEAFLPRQWPLDEAGDPRPC